MMFSATDSSVSPSSAAMSRQLMRGRKIVITTAGRSSRHNSACRPTSTLPPRGRQASSHRRSGGRRSSRGCSSRQQPVAEAPAAPDADVECGDEWAVDDAENMPREAAADRYDCRLTSTLPPCMLQRDIAQEQANSGTLLHHHHHHRGLVCTYKQSSRHNKFNNSYKIL